MTEPVDHHVALREWATTTGDPGVEAATELLLRAFAGWYAVRGQTWLQETADGGWYVDFQDLELNAASGGIREPDAQVLFAVASLGQGALLSLRDLVTMGRAELDLTLAAISHAGGSHLHSDIITTGDGSVSLEVPGTLYPWPAGSVYSSEGPHHG